MGKRKRQNNVVAKAPEVNSDDEQIDISQQDLDFFREHAEFSGFLADLNVDKLLKNEEVVQGSISDIKNGVYKQQAVEITEEIDYESTVRTFSSVQKEKAPATRLPIKSSDGTWTRQKIDQPEFKQVTETIETAAEPIIETPLKVNNKEVRKEYSTDISVEVEKITDQVNDSLTPEERFIESRNKLAKIASSIIEDPDAHIGRLKDLRKYTSDSDTRIVKLAVLTQLAVFKDIVPGFRVRDTSEEDKETILSKDVKKMRQYESTLLANYQAYLQCLEQMCKNNSPKFVDGDTGLLVVAMKCMCQLLDSCSHFNYSVNLMTSIVLRMNLILGDGVSRRYNVKPNVVGQTCCNAIVQLFKDDPSGDSSLIAVQLITNLVKNKKFMVRPAVLDTFLHLELSIDVQANNKRRKKAPRPKPGHVSRKNKKLQKHDLEVEREMREAEAVVDREEREKIHTNILKQVFVTYFRVLKEAPTSPLFASVLRGIVKFGHQISIDFFNDLIAVMRLITQKHGAEFSLVDSLQSVITAFSLVSGQADVLNLDMKEQFKFGYTILKRVRIEEQRKNKKNNIDELAIAKMIKHMIQLMFCKRVGRCLSPTRAASFVKRLAILASKLTVPDAILCVLDSMNELLHVSPSQVFQLFDDEDNRVFNGARYLPDLEDPDMCNPFQVSMTEIEEFKSHPNELVRNWIKREVKNWKTLMQ